MAGSTQCSVTSQECTAAICVHDTASVPHEALHMNTMTHSIYIIFFCTTLFT